RRAAQIAYDLHFQGVTLLFSWPSEGALLNYIADQNRAQWAVPHFRDFIRLVRTELGVERLHIIAHSMGNLVLSGGLVQLADVEGFGQIVFAAPDVDAGVFTNQVALFGHSALRHTLYASSQDRALRASQTLAGYPRAGEAGAGLVVLGGVDTIDAS